MFIDMRLSRRLLLPFRFLLSARLGHFRDADREAVRLEFCFAIGRFDFGWVVFAEDRWFCWVGVLIAEVLVVYDPHGGGSILAAANAINLDHLRNSSTGRSRGSA